MVFYLLSLNDGVRFRSSQLNLMSRYNKDEFVSISFLYEIHRPSELTGHNESNLEVDSNSSIFFPLQDSADVFFNTNLFKGVCLLSVMSVLLVTHLQNDSTFIDNHISILAFVLFVNL